MKRNDIIKLVAILSMLIDHLGVMFFPELRVLRFIGRLAFPLFAYLIVNGYEHTTNLRNYRLRLLYFAIVSQVPYMFFNYGLKVTPMYFNVLFLLLYATYVLQVFDKYKKTKNELYVVLGVYMILLPVILEYSVSGLNLSYSTYGLLMVLVFYYFKSFKKQFIVFTLLQLLYVYSLGVAYLVTYSTVLNDVSLTYLEGWFQIKSVFEVLKTNNYYLQLDGYFIQIWSILSLFVIKYSEKIFKITLHKYIAYAFYPVHMIVLIIIRMMVI